LGHFPSEKALVCPLCHCFTPIGVQGGLKSLK
jgi:hypothetical protein